MPYREGAAVPETTKSFAQLMQPIRSVEQIKGSSPAARPPMTGSA